MTKRKSSIIILAFFVFYANAQHLTYADLMRLVKIDKWSVLNDAVTAKGYKFEGSKNYHEKTDSAYFKAVWCKNCTYNFWGESYSFDKIHPHSLFIVRKQKNESLEYKIIFTGKQAFTTFMNAAKANGFKFEDDGIYSDYISVWYKRINKTKGYVEKMRFNEYSEKYEVWFWFEPIESNSTSSISNSQVQKEYTTTSQVPQNVPPLEQTNAAKEIDASYEPIFPGFYDKQNDPYPDDIPPSFPGGLQGLLNWLSDNIHYPPEAEAGGVEGRVVVSFIVEPDGSITIDQIVRRVDPFLDAEAMRLIKEMPKWHPGTQKGLPVRVKYNLPITFTLQKDPN